MLKLKSDIHVILSAAYVILSATKDLMIRSFVALSSIAAIIYT